jgi:hypothetical protein
VVPAERLLFRPLRRAFVIVFAALTLLVGVQDASASIRASFADPNTLGKGSADAVTTLRWVSPGVYQLDVQNTSGIGYINQFTWVPPLNLTVTAITSSEGGRCTLVGGSIQCNGKVAPPKCTCMAGGDLVVTFTARGLEPQMINGVMTYYGMVGAYLQIQQMTPVPYHIPSALPTVGLDLPLCQKGQKSTKLHPCVTF